MIITRVLRAAALVSLCAGAASALEMTSVSGRLAIGATGIFCVTEPCPWRGVIDLDNPERDPLRPLWSGEHLPVLRASREDATRIEAAWDSMECLEIEGEFQFDAADGADAPVLDVRHIVGPCA